MMYKLEDISESRFKNRLLRFTVKSGIFLTILSGLFCAIGNVVTEAILTKNNVYAVGFAQSLFQMSPLLPYMVWKRIQFVPDRSELFYFLACSICNAGVVMLMTVSFLMIPASDSVAISSTFTVVLSIVAPCFLPERFKAKFLINAIISVFGVILICQPTFIFPPDSNSSSSSVTIGILCALGSLLCNCGVSLLSKKISKTSACTCSCFYTLVSMISFLIAMPIAGHYQYLSDFSQAMMIVWTGILNSVGSVFYFAAFNYCDAGPLSVVNNGVTPITLMLEIIFLKSKPHWSTYVGILLTTSAAILTGLQQWDTGWITVRNWTKTCFATRKHKQENDLLLMSNPEES